MQVVILDMPASGVVKVKIDDQEVRGYIVRSTDGRFTIFPLGRSADPLRTHPKSREAAGLLLAYYHLEMERKALDDRKEAEERNQAKRAHELVNKPRKEKSATSKEGAKQVRES